MPSTPKPFPELVEQTHASLQAFTIEHLEAVGLLEEVAARAEAEIGTLAKDPIPGMDLIWLGLSLQGASAVATILRAVQPTEDTADHEARLNSLRDAGARMQAAAARIARFNAERLKGETKTRTQV